MPTIEVLQLNPGCEQVGDGFAPVIVLRYQLEGGEPKDVCARLPEIKEDAQSAKLMAHWLIDQLNVHGTRG